MPTYIFRGPLPAHYPYPPIMARLNPGDEIDLDAADVPADVPLELKSATEPTTGSESASAPAAKKKEG